MQKLSSDDYAVLKGYIDLLEEENATLKEVVELQKRHEEIDRRLLEDDLLKMKTKHKNDLDEYREIRNSLRNKITYIESRCNSRIDPIRESWSGLQDNRIESLLHSLFHDAGMDTTKHYASSEVAVTGALSAYLRNHAINVAAEVVTRLEDFFSHHPIRFTVDYLDCQKRHDVGGADLALVLHLDIPGRESRISFSAFQAKKINGASMAIRAKDRAQLHRLMCFTEAAYYLLYPCSNPGAPPSVIPARTLYGYLAARGTHSIPVTELSAVSIDFCDYFAYDLLPGWSGDCRRPDEVQEFLENALRPIHIVQVNIDQKHDHTHQE